MDQTEIDLEAALATLGSLIRKYPNMSASCLLPLLFRFEGKPLATPNKFFLHDPCYKLLHRPRQLIIKGSRQIGKSVMLTTLGQFDICREPYFNVVYAFPQKDQAEWFSNNYFKPIALSSPLTKPLMNNKDAVLQRDFATGGSAFFRYIGDSADRARGVKTDECMVDEVQGHDLDAVDVLLASMSASPHKLVRYTGTPKTFDNPIQVLWERSSQAVWHIPCGCGLTNICNVDNHLLKMLGETTLICAKCGRPVDSSKGFYVHKYPERQLLFAGYHMPQPIFPIHYGNELAWSVLKDAIKVKPTYYWMNELLGESYDSGTKLITELQLKEAAIAEYCQPSDYPTSNYMANALGIDWGGKGKETAKDSEEFISNTAIALGGIRTDGKVEIRYISRTPYTMDYTAEAAFVKDIAQATIIDFVGSDNGGAGDLREHVLRAAGVPAEIIIPFTYTHHSSKKPVVFWEPPSDNTASRGERVSYSLHKTRALTLVLEGIKRGYILLPTYERVKSELSDFLALYEETKDTPTGGASRLIRRQSKKTDDIVHAICFCCIALYLRTGAWPDFAKELVNLAAQE